MSITPVGGAAAPAQSHAAPASTAKPEATEIPGAPDHDSDADNGSAHALAQAATPAKITPGQINLKA
jgi:hypothetical protein